MTNPNSHPSYANRLAQVGAGVLLGVVALFGYNAAQSAETPQVVDVSDIEEWVGISGSENVDGSN